MIERQMMTCSQRRGGVLRFALDSEPVSLDPSDENTLADLHVLSAIYDRLLEVDPQLNIRPNLIETWEQESPTTYRMHVRGNVRFHHGKPLTADAVRWSLLHLACPGSAMQSALSMIESIETEGDRILRISLHEPYAPFLSTIASYPGMVLSPEKAEVAGPNGQLLHLSYGTGPFRIVEKTETALVLVRNEDYWDRDEEGTSLPYADRLEMPWLSSGSEMLSALETGELSLINEVPYAQVPRLRERSDLDFACAASHSVNGIRLNCERPPFSSRPLRQAVAYAIGREEMLEQVNLGVGYAVHGPIPPASWAYDREFRPCLPDPERVRDLLTAAGCPDGFEFAIKIQSERMRQMVGFIANQLAVYGIRMHIEVVDVADLIRDMEQRKYQALFLGAAGGTDPDEILYPYFHSSGSSNHTGYANAEVDRLLEQGRRESEPERRRELYRRVEEMIVDDSPFISTRSGLSFIVKRPDICDIQPHPDLGIRWKHIWVKSERPQVFR